MMITAHGQRLLCPFTGDTQNKLRFHQFLPNFTLQKNYFVGAPDLHFGGHQCADNNQPTFIIPSDELRFIYISKSSKSPRCSSKKNKKKNNPFAHSPSARRSLSRAHTHTPRTRVQPKLHKQGAVPVLSADPGTRCSGSDTQDGTGRH